MNRFFGGLFTLRANIDALTRLRSRYLQALAVTAATVVALSFTLSLVTGAMQTSTIINNVLAYSVCLGVLVLVRRGWLTVAALIFIVIGGLFVFTGTNTAFLLAGTLVIITAAAVGNRAIYTLTNLAFIARVAYDFYIGISTSPTHQLPTDVRDKFLTLLALGVVSASTRFFINQAERSADEAKANATLLQAVAETGEILAKLLNMNSLLPRAVELIQERFGFYHVQVFLLDETNEYASLAASTGATGQKLLERRHRLAVGSKSVIGQVTLSAKPVIARDTDAIYFHNELLPNTRAELALPVMDGDKMIGALDVQSRRVDAFNPEAVQALQVMANLLGTSVRNATFFEQQERGARETKRLFLESESNLREIQRLNQQLTGQGWENYMRNRRKSNGITMDQERVVADDRWSDALVKASETRQTVTDSSSGVIAVPVMLGGEVIGAIEVEPGNSGKESETVEMVKAIAQRLAISLDKARLFEESQEATAQEQRINEIVARYQTVTSVDDLLQITLAELSQSLGARRGAIRLGTGGSSSLNGESPA
ncbi:MAG: GAF domain-containing protein [Chloroflexota bacterium]